MKIAPAVTETRMHVVAIFRVVHHSCPKRRTDIAPRSSGEVRWTICNLIPFAKGDSRVMSLGHPSYPRPKGTRNHSMAEKRGYVEIGETGPRKTRVAWSKLDRLNPNPDRGLSYSVVRPIEHDVIECRPFPFRGYGKPAR